MAPVVLLIFPTELTNTQLDFHIETDKKDDFTQNYMTNVMTLTMINFPFIGSIIPAAPVNYDINIFQPRRFSRAHVQYSDFLDTQF